MPPTPTCRFRHFLDREGPRAPRFHDLPHPTDTVYTDVRSNALVSVRAVEAGDPLLDGRR
jgi:hypothetical protein